MGEASSTLGALGWNPSSERFVGYEPGRREDVTLANEIQFVAVQTG
jgi:hypothetical protein